jgi:formate hydrogenlyase transcriptional activator
VLVRTFCEIPSTARRDWANRRVPFVADKQFRDDLYYRLNVIPLSLPALRERAEDIPLLVEHFVKRFSARLGKPIDAIPDGVIKVLKARDWPGNIRELQNFIERAVVLSPGPVLCPTLTESKHMTSQPTAAATRTLAEAEREHIRRRGTARRAAHDFGVQDAKTWD